MEFTSASANKYLKRLQDEKDRLLRIENETSTYIVADGEEPDPPHYDYAGTRAAVADIDDKMRTIRHTLHRFNMETILPESGMSIDEALIALAQMSGVQSRVRSLSEQQQKTRLRDRYFGSAPGPVEYRYANYDIAEAENDYREISDQIAALQLEIDLANQTQLFSVDI